jgi:hypothetical protein
MNVVLSYGLGWTAPRLGPRPPVARSTHEGGGAFPIFARLPPCGEGGDRLPAMDRQEQGERHGKEITPTQAHR